MHIDMNAFYASVVQHLDPALRGRPVAVVGDPERRSGIILAKSREAKACGVKTAEAIWQARQKCPELIVVPPDYAAYKRYSTLARMICYEYTNQVEPFGLDESWMDVTVRIDEDGRTRPMSVQWWDGRPIRSRRWSRSAAAPPSAWEATGSATPSSSTAGKRSSTTRTRAGLWRRKSQRGISAELGRDHEGSSSVGSLEKSTSIRMPSSESEDVSRRRIRHREVQRR